MIRIRSVFVLATLIAISGAAAQTPAADPSAKLREVLPADVAQRVLAKIAEARALELPAAALENRALKFAARGVPAAAIEQSVNEHADRMQRSRDALQTGRGQKPESDEVDAGAEALRKGVDGAQVSALARSAPSGRSLAVPLLVIGSLIDRGLGADDALLSVQERLRARASDRELQQLPASANKPALTGQDLAATKRPPQAGPPGKMPTVIVPGPPRNGGKGTVVRPVDPRKGKP